MFALVALGFLPGLSGCKTIESSEAKHTEDILSAAGFKQFPANTPERISMLTTMKARSFHTVVKDGKTYYVYPDPTHCNCLYAGTEQEYQEYHKLALQQSIAEDNLMAADAAEDASMNWGSWGPWW